MRFLPVSLRADFAMFPQGSQSDMDSAPAVLGFAQHARDDAVADAAFGHEGGSPPRAKSRTQDDARFHDVGPAGIGAKSFGGLHYFLRAVSVRILAQFCKAWRIAARHGNFSVAMRIRFREGEAGNPRSRAAVIDLISAG
jgi:hypothetical protein